MDKCGNCGALIGELETSFAWKGKTVCDTCFGKLKQALISGEPIPYETPAKRRRVFPIWAIGVALAVFLIMVGLVVTRLGVSSPVVTVPSPSAATSVPTSNSAESPPDRGAGETR